jgi:hypothetical protein
VGRAGAATGRNLGDNRGQQGITNLEVSGGSQRLAWGAKLLDWAFTRQRPQAVRPSLPIPQGVLRAAHQEGGRWWGQSPSSPKRGSPFGGSVMDAEADGSRRFTVQDSNQAIPSRSGKLNLAADGEYGPLVTSFRDADRAPYLEFSTKLDEGIAPILMFSSQFKHEPPVRLRPRHQEADARPKVKWDRRTICREGHMSVGPSGTGHVEQAVLSFCVVGKGHELDLGHRSPPMLTFVYRCIHYFS